MKNRDKTIKTVSLANLLIYFTHKDKHVHSNKTLDTVTLSFKILNPKEMLISGLKWTKFRDPCSSHFCNSQTFEYINIPWLLKQKDHYSLHAPGQAQQNEINYALENWNDFHLVCPYVCSWCIVCVQSSCLVVSNIFSHFENDLQLFLMHFQ